MRRRVFIGSVGGLAASLAFPATGQGVRPLPHVSFLSHSSPEEWGSRLAEFRAELRALGYAEGRDVIVEVWGAENRLERLPALIAEILNSKPAVIVTHGSPNVATLQKPTSTVPIVFAAAADPVGQGFIKSYRRPGGNITGIMFANTDIKVLELVKIVMPGVSRIGVMLNPDLPASNSWIDILPSSGKALGLQSRVVKATSREGVGPAFIEALKAKVQALIVAPMAPFVGLHALLVELQFKHRLPTFYAVGEAADAGGLAS